jgi:hypothetical protein
MSAETLRAVEDAITAHLAEEYDEPWLVTHWYAIVAASDVNMDRTNYVHIAQDAPLHVSLGLVRIADNRLAALIGADDDDDL